MVDDTCCLFDLSDTPFLAHVSAIYPQPQILWQLYPPLQQLLPCVIFMLRIKLYKQEIHKMRSSETVPAVRQLLLHSVDRPYSPRFIPPSS